MSLELILGAVFGGGFATLIATVARVIDGRRKGRLESEDSVITRLEAENRKARERADEAEMETEDYRKRMHQAEDEVARYRRALIQAGVPLPDEGPGHVH
jgi:chromosome segregation ATPase